MLKTTRLFQSWLEGLGQREFIWALLKFPNHVTLNPYKENCSQSVFGNNISWTTESQKSFELKS
jgi:hypothetical protein